MNILSELLPGTRQLRTPLAIGYLWLLVAWINAPRLPARIRHSEIIIRANQDLHHLSPALIIIVVSFVAYLIGLCFEVADDIAVNLALVVGSALVALSIILSAVGLIIGLWEITIPLLAIASFRVYRQSRKYKPGAEKIVNQIALNLFLPILAFSYSVKMLLLRLWSPGKLAKDELVADKIVEILDKHPEFVERFCETLTIVDLRIACEVAGLKQLEPAQRQQALNGDTVDLRKISKSSSINPEHEKLLREYLRQRLRTSREITRSVTLRTMKTSDIRGLVNKAFADTIATIQADMPPVFEKFDRLKVEGEFRRGISLPLAIALGSLASLYTHDSTTIVLASSPVIFIYFSGMRKQEEADSIVVSSINAGIAHVKLEVTDSRLLQWSEKRVSSRKRVNKQQSPLHLARIPAIRHLFNQRQGHTVILNPEHGTHLHSATGLKANPETGSENGQGYGCDR
jgi:hypothetical protein